VDAFDRLRGQLRALPSDAVAEPEGGRVGAVLVLLSESGDDLEIVYTRRRDDLAHHPGQVSFPGGRVDPGETIEGAAVREAVEEIALDPATIELVGRLPAFYIPPSRFWLQAAVARWTEPHPLVPAEAEVSEVLRIPLVKLRDPRRWRCVELSSAGRSWAWQLDERHLLWGATAVVTAVLLGILDPDWSRGTEPTDLGDERLVRPWEQRLDGAVPRPGPALLPDVAELPVDTAPHGAEVKAAPADGALASAGSLAAEAVWKLLAATRRGNRPVVVLAGAGGNGAAGMETAQRLAARGVPIQVVLSRPSADLPARWAALVAGLEEAATFSGAVPPASLVVDALVGGGLRGALRGHELAVVHALRHRTAPVVSLDLPSGLDPRRGMVGELVTADVTVALGGPWPGVFNPGLGPFVGDLYLADLGRKELLRLIPPADRQGWRE
jgi:NAD(P)H-hydrate repair Nnr-like enzyme with NAD(P)H-hydrate epimerase domain/8-oxo-dGTP pyrophosphatase MutT (NUDIX family)